jgi:hypothetical protein
VDPDCPVCNGLGVLVLGNPALRRYPVEVVSRAVEYALEAQAQHDLTTRGVSLGQARKNLTAMVARLIQAGVLAGWSPQGAAAAPMPAVSRAATRRHARELSEESSQLAYSEGTGALLAAPPVTYEEGAVPVDGSPAGFSRAGYLCSLAKVTNPLDVLTVRVVGTPNQSSIDRRGDVLGKALGH